MRIFSLIAMIPLLVIAEESEDLYGIEDNKSPFMPAWYAGLTLERIPFDSITASFQTGAEWSLDFDNTSLQLFPSLSAIQVGSDDPLRLYELSFAISMQWGILQFGSTPWFAQSPEDEFRTYGITGYMGLGGEPWKGAWLESGTYADWADSSNTNYGLYAFLSQHWLQNALWHGPALDLDIPLENEDSSTPRRGRKATFLSAKNALGKLSYQMGYSPEKQIWSVSSQLGIAYSPLRDWDTWGSASVSFTW